MVNCRTVDLKQLETLNTLKVIRATSFLHYVALQCIVCIKRTLSTQVAQSGQSFCCPQDKHYWFYYYRKRAAQQEANNKEKKAAQINNGNIIARLVLDIYFLVS